MTKIRQHWVPQFYLRKFAVPGFRNRKNAQIWVTDLETGESEKRKIKDIAAEEYLYSHVKEDGSRCFRIEDKLAKLETTIARLYPCVAEGYPDLQQSWGIKKLMALYLATLLLRHPEKQREQGEIHKRLVSFYDKFPKDSLGRPAITHVIEQGRKIELDTSDYSDWRAADENDLKQMFAEQIEVTSARFAERLFAKRWAFLCSDQPVFFTSDKPFAKVHPNKKRFGIDTAGTMLFFPISPYRILQIGERDEGEVDGFYPYPREEAGQCNFVTLMNATQFILSHEPIDERVREINAFGESVAGVV